MHKFSYDWRIKDGYPAPGVDYHGLKVFSCFACGGGSTMGYKLAGYDVIGRNEIDKRMMAVYKTNHHPKYAFLEPIQTFKNRDDLPTELYDLDILDGSPPCSSFSTAGNREKDWGKEKKFREGQAKQVLDTLFFDFIDLAKKLRPKVVIAENVKGLLLGNAQRYVSRILDAFYDAGYYVDFQLLNAAEMGVPQRRERVFFTAIRKDLYEGNFTDLFGTRPALDLNFNEPYIPFSEIDSNEDYHDVQPHIECLLKKMKNEYGQLAKFHEKGSFFSNYKMHPNRPINTITGHGNLYHPKFMRRLSDSEFIKGGAFPTDYDFMNSKTYYIIGMSVPPIMMAQIATRIKRQWLTKKATK